MNSKVKLVKFAKDNLVIIGSPFKHNKKLFADSFSF